MTLIASLVTNPRPGTTGRFGIKFTRNNLFGEPPDVAFFWVCWSRVHKEHGLQEITAVPVALPSGILIFCSLSFSY
jgi:hypothetical protein